MTEHVFGEAADFYRLRLVVMDEGDAPELEWREDILWRRPEQQRPDEYELYRVEAVAVDDETATPLHDFADMTEARMWLSSAEVDLAEMTKAQFEEAYMATDRPTASDPSEE